jgi:hypothetical protein
MLKAMEESKVRDLIFNQFYPQILKGGQEQYE